ncbi:MAG TPA: tripartite tricarboxylate transporter substrate-binding protein [Burkholderiaceae bacterium]|nr:tripartite tricarboxylate transporter substrate-binding protein [Burkholderiaceae bacterium]
MYTTKRLMLAALLSTSLLSITGVQAQDNNLRLIVPYPPGGSTDLAARIVANELQTRLGSNVVVENMVGAGGRLAMQNIKRMPADANVLVIANPALITVAPLVFKNTGYDPDADFQALSQVSIYEFGVAVGTAVPVREFPHMMAWIKANPEKANFGVPATGSLPHFFALMVNKATNTNSPVIGYKGSAPLNTDLMGGHIPVAIDTVDTMLPLHIAGKIKILGTSGEKRSVPTIPTLKESGFNIAATGWNVIFAKSSMPADKAARIAKEVAAIMQLPAVRDKFIAAKAEPISSTQQQTKDMLSKFKAQWQPVIQQSGLKFD